MLHLSSKNLFYRFLRQPFKFSHNDVLNRLISNSSRLVVFGKMLRVILVGYGELASSIMLGVLESGHKLVGVFRWDRVEKSSLMVNLKDSIYPDNFTSLIKSLKISEIKARSVNSPEFINQALRLEPDVIIVGSWGEILKKDAIILPKIGCINCHPSLLPKHRGSNPYTSVIREGEMETGVTFHLINEKVDTGPILLQKKVPILIEDTGGTLRTRCSYEARKALKELLDGLETAQFLPRKQIENEASYFPRWTDIDARINWNHSALRVHNQIRGYQPWMKCYTEHNNNFLILSSSRLVALKKPADIPGVVLAKKDNGIIVATGDSHKAIFLENITIYGFLGKIRSNFYVKSIRVGDVLD